MDKEMLTCARKIKNYCSNHRCEDCVFYRFGYQKRRKTPSFSYGDIRRVHRICVSN